MKMLRWMYGVTRLDKICNVGGSLGVPDIADKMQESRLRWYGHVKKRPPDYVGNFILMLDLPGRKPRGRQHKAERCSAEEEKEMQCC
ncbi:uncharacterized protein LOC114250402 [Bombyx mandarina]|uniref:Uncharacterized protein LOC114250402 n=1 Tax=Bombyx mandarina TaxID=7092 RepID=A0A6J2KIM8_BOMMA|nr:uncharacterized protein LOC114250402 [Bombyx mandarina]